MEQYRHGDLLIERIPEMPSGLKQAANRTLALGEVTGHHHTLTEEAEVFEAATGEKFFVVKEKATLTHQEHGPIQFTTGFYRVIRQREYSPERNRYVAD